MKKMNKPEVEAIRFDSNDVIATSGGPGARVFYALGSEVKEATNSDSYSGKWYYTYGIPTGSTQFYQAAWDEVDEHGLYMWYDGGWESYSNEISTYNKRFYVGNGKSWRNQNDEPVS